MSDTPVLVTTPSVVKHSEAQPKREKGKPKPSSKKRLEAFRIKQGTKELEAIHNTAKERTSIPLDKLLFANVPRVQQEETWERHQETV
jgi:hypothetical protein